MKNWNKANFLRCKKIPIDLLNLSVEVCSTLLVLYPNTLLTRAHFHYSLWDHWKIKSLCFVLNTWNIQLNLGNFSGFQSSSWPVRAEGVPRIEDLVFYPMFFLSPYFWRMEKRWGWRLVNQWRRFCVIFVESMVRFHPQPGPWWNQCKALLRALTLKPYTSPFKCMEFCICCIWRPRYTADACLKQN